MNTSHPEHDSHAEDQAALWAAKIDGASLTATDRATLDTWLAADPRHRTLLSEYCQLSTDLEVILPAVVGGGIVSLPDERRPAASRAGRATWIAATLAAAAAIAVTAVWVARPTAQTETVATSVAQRRTLKLADGSVVELNARTSLLVDLSGSERRVRLADGEAFFTVAKDHSRPFIVETPAGSVRVTGTVFDVHSDAVSTLAVTVVEGSVQVSPGAARDGTMRAPVSLRANDHFVMTATGGQVSRLSETDLEDALAWREGFVVFTGTPLPDAVAKFARYHGRSITVAPSIANLKVGSRYSLDDLDSFLAAIEAALPVRVSRESSGAIAIEPRTGSSGSITP